MIQVNFVGAFTGLMTVYVLPSGRRLSMKPGVRIEKGKPYVLQFDRISGMVKLIPVVVPETFLKGGVPL